MSITSFNLFTRPRIFSSSPDQPSDLESFTDLKNTKKPSQNNVSFSFISRFFQCNKQIARNQTYVSSYNSISELNSKEPNFAVSSSQGPEIGLDLNEIPLPFNKVLKKAPLNIVLPPIIEKEEEVEVDTNEFLQTNKGHPSIVMLLKNPITECTRESISDLLSKGAFLNTPFYYDKNFDLQGTPVSYYIAQKDLERLKIVLSFGADSHKSDSEGKRPLTRALEGLAQSNTEEEILLYKTMIQELIKHGVQINLDDAHEPIPLYQILDDLKKCKELNVSLNSKTITNYLEATIHHNAFDIYTPDLDGKTPFYKIVEEIKNCKTKEDLNFQIELCKCLIKYRAHMTQPEEKKPLHQILEDISTCECLEICGNLGSLGGQLLLLATREERNSYFDLICEKLRDPQTPGEKKEIFNQFYNILLSSAWLHVNPEARNGNGADRWKQN